MIHHANGYTDRLEAQIAKGLSLASDQQLADEAERRGLIGPAWWVHLLALAVAFAAGVALGWLIWGLR